MLVGLGTGSTASCFIDSLIERCKHGLKVRAVSSSIASAERARAGGIPLVDLDLVIEVDLTVDGADEVDERNRMIKGKGGAHVREKILASMSLETLYLVDESKLVKELGACGLPVEILPFCWRATLHKLERMGYEGRLRMQSGKPFVTDNGNYLFDIHTPSSFRHPEEEHQRLVLTPGVIDTGLFFHLATRVLIGYEDGTLAIREGVDGES